MRTRLTAAEIVQRNERIVTDRFANRFTIDELADKYELSDRMIRHILAEWKETHPPLREHDPIDIIDILVEGFLDDVRAATRVYESERGNGTTQIQAINARRQARKELLELLQATNVLPNNLGDLSIVIDHRVMVQQVIEVLQRHDVSLELVQEMRAALAGQRQLDPGKVFESAEAA